MLNRRCIVIRRDLHLRHLLLGGCAQESNSDSLGRFGAGTSDHSVTSFVHLRRDSSAFIHIGCESLTRPHPGASFWLSWQHPFPSLVTSVLWHARDKPALYFPVCNCIRFNHVPDWQSIKSGRPQAISVATVFYGFVRAREVTRLYRPYCNVLWYKWRPHSTGFAACRRT